MNPLREKYREVRSAHSKSFAKHWSTPSPRNEEYEALVHAHESGFNAALDLVQNDIEKLLPSVDQASVDICSEFCTRNDHSEVCVRLTTAIAKFKGVGK